MNAIALIFMLAAQLIITFFTIYFFIKVLKSKRKPDLD